MGKPAVSLTSSGPRPLSLVKSSAPTRDIVLTGLSGFVLGNRIRRSYTPCLLETVAKPGEPAIHGKDPFDPDFQTIFSPQFQVIPPVTQDTCQIAGLANAINGAQNRAGRAVSYQGAINVTAGREQSAFTFANDSSVNSQDTALGGYENMIVAELRAAQAGFQGVAAMIAGTACDETVTQNDIAVFLADVRARGVAALPVQEVNLIVQFGVDPQVIVDDLTSVSYDPSQFPLSVSAMLNRVAQ